MRRRRLERLADRRLAGWVRPSPEAEAAMDAEVEATYTERLCGWGHCATVYDGTGRPTVGGGPARCPCGWTAQPTGRRAGMGCLPRTPVKARGRHGSRVQRSARRWRRVSAAAEAFLGRRARPLLAPVPLEYVERRPDWS